jgi:hypothetical protein
MFRDDVLSRRISAPATATDTSTHVIFCPLRSSNIEVTSSVSRPRRYSAARPNLWPEDQVIGKEPGLFRKGDSAHPNRLRGPSGHSANYSNRPGRRAERHGRNDDPANAQATTEPSAWLDGRRGHALRGRSAARELAPFSHVSVARTGARVIQSRNCSEACLDNTAGLLTAYGVTHRVW